MDSCSLPRLPTLSSFFTLKKVLNRVIAGFHSKEQTASKPGSQNTSRKDVNMGASEKFFLESTLVNNTGEMARAQSELK